MKGKDNVDVDRPQISGRLKRLGAENYRGRSYVHWTFTVQQRASGWLSAQFHEELKAALQNWLVRYHLCCYAYCVMPDHGHFLIVGLRERADQRAFVRQLTREWNHMIRPAQLSRQAYDVVLREKDRQKDALGEIARYIWCNPVRAGLVTTWTDWPYLGCLLPGYRSLDPRKPDFRTNFWSGYHDQADV
jgi:REP element-mobilizing transposase RayT